MSAFRRLVMCLLLAAAGLAADEAFRFRFSKPIDRAPSKDEEIVAFNLDSDIYAATRSAYPDLRVVDDRNAEAPYQLELDVEHKTERSRQFFQTKIVTLRPDGDAIEIHLRLPEKSPAAEGLTLATPLTNYERKVQIAGSTDGKEWTPRIAEGIIFDYSRYMDVNNRDLALPKNSYREFKITVADVTDEKESPFRELTRTLRGAREEQRIERTTIERRPFRIDRITAWYTTSLERVKKVRTAVYPVAGLEVQDDAAKKQTIVNVRTRREPVTRLILTTPSRNFSRKAVVQVPVVRGVKSDWQPVAEASIFNFHFRDQHREQIAIDVPEQRSERIRIVIHNEDNPPLNVTGVEAHGNVQRVVFLAQPARTYRVHYGSETVEAPKYEAATVLTTLRKDYQPALAKLGAEVESPDFRKTPGSLRGLLNNWIFLGAVIALMVAVLGWCLFRAGRRLENLPRE